MGFICYHRCMKSLLIRDGKFGFLLALVVKLIQLGFYLFGNSGSDVFGKNIIFVAVGYVFFLMNMLNMWILILSFYGLLGVLLLLWLFISSGRKSKWWYFAGWYVVLNTFTVLYAAMGIE